MESKQISLKEVYIELKNLEVTLQKKGIIDKSELSDGNNEIIWDWPEKVPILADEDLLGKDWLSQEDEGAWKDL